MTAKIYEIMRVPAGSKVEQLPSGGIKATLPDGSIKTVELIDGMITVSSVQSLGTATIKIGGVAPVDPTPNDR